MSRVRKSVTAGATQVMYRIALSLGLELRSPTSNENTEIHDWPSFEKRQRRSFDDFKPGRIEGRCLFADAGSRSRGDLPTDKYCCRLQCVAIVVLGLTRTRFAVFHTQKPRERDEAKHFEPHRR
jgi:hypothetical protein